MTHHLDRRNLAVRLTAALSLAALVCCAGTAYGALTFTYVDSGLGGMGPALWDHTPSGPNWLPLNTPGGMTGRYGGIASSSEWGRSYPWGNADALNNRAPAGLQGAGQVEVPYDVLWNGVAGAHTEPTAVAFWTTWDPLYPWPGPYGTPPTDAIDYMSLPGERPGQGTNRASLTIDFDADYLANDPANLAAPDFSIWEYDAQGEIAFISVTDGDPSDPLSTWVQIAQVADTDPPHAQLANNQFDFDLMSLGVRFPVKGLRITGTWGTIGGNTGPGGSAIGEWSWGWDLSGFTYDPESLNGFYGVPEPSALVLGALGTALLCGLAGWRKTSRKKAP